jgi:CheY-like chemotaxis protein
MNNFGPIVIVENDEDDRFVLQNAMVDIQIENELIFFANGQKAYDFLTVTPVRPFIIISDINMPGMTGIELRDKLHENRVLRAIPYLFYTTESQRGRANELLMESAQGYFVKPVSITELHQTLRIIVAYWRRCSSPNSIHN